MQTKTLYNLLSYINANYKKMIFRVWACIVRLQVLICYVNTRLQRIINILLKSPGLSVISDPRNVLRHKQGRLTLQKRVFLLNVQW